MSSVKTAAHHVTKQAVGKDPVEEDDRAQEAIIALQLLGENTSSTPPTTSSPREHKEPPAAMLPVPLLAGSQRTITSGVPFPSPETAQPESWRTAALASNLSTLLSRTGSVANGGQRPEVHIKLSQPGNTAAQDRGQETAHARNDSKAGPMGKAVGGTAFKIVSRGGGGGFVESLSRGCGTLASGSRTVAPGRTITTAGAQLDIPPLKRLRTATGADEPAARPAHHVHSRQQQPLAYGLSERGSCPTQLLMSSTRESTAVTASAAANGWHGWEHVWKDKPQVPDNTAAVTAWPPQQLLPLQGDQTPQPSSTQQDGPFAALQPAVLQQILQHLQGPGASWGSVQALLDRAQPSNPPAVAHGSHGSLMTLLADVQRQQKQTTVEQMIQQLLQKQAEHDVGGKRSHIVSSAFTGEGPALAAVVAAQPRLSDHVTTKGSVMPSHTRQEGFTRAQAADAGVLAAMLPPAVRSAPVPEVESKHVEGSSVNRGGLKLLGQLSPRGVLTGHPLGLDEGVRMVCPAEMGTWTGKLKHQHNDSIVELCCLSLLVPVAYMERFPPSVFITTLVKRKVVKLGRHYRLQATLPFLSDVQASKLERLERMTQVAVCQLQQCQLLVVPNSPLAPGLAGDPVSGPVGVNVFLMV